LLFHLFFLWTFIFTWHSIWLKLILSAVALNYTITSNKIFYWFREWFWLYFYYFLFLLLFCFFNWILFWLLLFWFFLNLLMLIF